MAALKCWSAAMLCALAGSASAQVLTLTETSKQANEIPLGYPVPLPVDSLTPVAGFRSYAALEDRLAALALGEDIAAVTVGETVRERPITAYRIGDDDGVTVEGFTEPAALINGTIHAREWASPEVVTGLIERFATARSDSGFYRYLLDNLNLIVVPVLNVDGFLQTQRYPTRTLQSEYAPDLQQIPSSAPAEYRNYPRDGRLRRKNMRDADEILCAASQSGCTADGMFGVDLNRNNDSKFFDSGNGNSDNPADLLYHGASRGSEPEIQALYAAAALGPRERLRFFSDTHSFGRVLFGADTGNVRRDAITRTLAERMSAATVGAIDRYPYDPTPPDVGIGSTDEYFGNAEQIPAYTLEIEPRGSSAEYGGFGYHHDGFILPASQIDRVRRELADAYSLGLYRMAGPPSLIAVDIRRADSGASVYKASWQRDGAGRRLVIDTSSPVVAGVDYRLRLGFDKPMRVRTAAGEIAAYRGQGAPLAVDVRLTKDGALQQILRTDEYGWRREVDAAAGARRYADDSYIVDLCVPGSATDTSPLTLSVDAQDLSGQSLDANPATVLDWTAGWRRYEDADGRDSTDTGGPDRNHQINVIAPAEGNGACSKDNGGGGGGALPSMTLAILLGLSLLAYLRHRFRAPERQPDE